MPKKDKQVNFVAPLASTTVLDSLSHWYPNTLSRSPVRQCKNRVYTYCPDHGASQSVVGEHVATDYSDALKSIDRDQLHGCDKRTSASQTTITNARCGWWPHACLLEVTCVCRYVLPRSSGGVCGRGLQPHAAWTPVLGVRSTSCQHARLKKMVSGDSGSSQWFLF